MSFESEAAMKEVASEALKNGFRRDTLKVIREFDYGPGKADLVFADISEKYHQRRTDQLDIDERIEDKSRLRCFLHIHGKKPITKAHYLQIGAIKKRIKERALSWLIDNNFVKETGNKIHTAPNLRRHVTTTISAELKLTKWRQALNQAQRGSSFANYRYVVLDQANASPALDSIEEFVNSNIGLITLDQSGDFTIHYSPDRISPYSNLTTWKLNEKTVSEPVGNVAAD
jgi:hypothetical protein